MSSFYNYIKSLFNKEEPKPISGGRRTGRTTRIVDALIQDFFTTGRCLVKDHYWTSQADRLVLKKTLRRLSVEHELNESDLKIAIGRKIYIENKK